MTGFSRRDGGLGATRWTWEWRSVNGKGLDIRLRLPAGLERLELPVRERAARLITRGNVAATLTVTREAAGDAVRLNETMLTALAAAYHTIGAHMPVAPPTLDGLLALRGLIDGAGEVDEAVQAGEDRAMLADADAAISALVRARSEEGAAIGAVLAAQIDRISALTVAAEKSPARTAEAIRERLARQVAELLGAVPQLDPQRLHQEAVLLATRADIREELDRLTAHVGQARALIGEGGAVGRRLDFLAQEFNREANTLCSKANDKDLTAIGLDLKTVVDQLREQIQNIE